MKELPRYRCHKEVWALKLVQVQGQVLTPVDADYPPFEVPQAYLDKHQPVPGGYFVQYRDGYISFSPAQAFEEGYTRLP